MKHGIHRRAILADYPNATWLLFSFVQLILRTRLQRRVSRVSHHCVSVLKKLYEYDYQIVSRVTNRTRRSESTCLTVRTGGKKRTNDNPTVGEVQIDKSIKKLIAGLPTTTRLTEWEWKHDVGKSDRTSLTRLTKDASAAKYRRPTHLSVASIVTR